MARGDVFPKVKGQLLSQSVGRAERSADLCFAHDRCKSRRSRCAAPRLHACIEKEPALSSPLEEASGNGQTLENTDVWHIGLCPVSLLF